MSSFADLGVSGINHFGLATNNLEEALYFMLQIPGSRLLRGPGDNHVQQVRYAFVDTGRGVIELLEPLSQESPINRIVAAGGGVYHVCLEVESIDAVEKHLAHRERSWVVAPIPDPAFDGRRIGFVLDENLGLVEFVETRPVFSENPNRSIENAHTTNTYAHESGERDKLLASVIEIVARVLSVDASKVNEDTGLASSPDWDSLAQLQIITQVESFFAKKIPSSEIANLSDVRSIVSYLSS
jgi:acyl carrier protein